MNRYTPHVVACALLLVVAAAARALLYWPPFVEYFPYLMWVHVAIIALGFYGFWVLRKSSQPPFQGVVSFFRGLPLWLGLLAIPVVYSAAPMVSMSLTSLGTTPDGQPVHSKSWSEQNGHHYVILNRTTKVEITRAEYLEANREGYAGFASAWIFFSYVMLVLWQYIWRRQQSHAG